MRDVRFKIIPIFLLLILYARAAFPFNEPDGFAGLKWGSSLAEIKAKHKKVIRDPSFEESPREVSYMADGKIGEFSATIDYHLVDGKLQAVTVQFYHVLFDDVLKAFVERYGQPTTAQDGAVWQGKNSLVLLWKKFPDIFASIQSGSYQDFTLSRQKEKAKSAAKDL